MTDIDENDQAHLLCTKLMMIGQYDVLFTI